MQPLWGHLHFGHVHVSVLVVTILRWKDGAWLPNCIHYFAGNKILELTSTKIKSQTSQMVQTVNQIICQRFPLNCSKGHQQHKHGRGELKPGRNSPSQLKTQTLLLATNGGHLNSLCFMVTGSLLEPASKDNYRYCSCTITLASFSALEVSHVYFSLTFSIASWECWAVRCDEHYFLNLKSVHLKCFLCQMKDDQHEQTVVTLLDVSAKWWSYFSQRFKAGWYENLSIQDGQTYFRNAVLMSTNQANFHMVQLVLTTWSTWRHGPWKISQNSANDQKTNEAATLPMLQFLQILLLKLKAGYR